jgi:hypothetical protein
MFASHSEGIVLASLRSMVAELLAPSAEVISSLIESVDVLGGPQESNPEILHLRAETGL